MAGRIETAASEVEGHTTVLHTLVVQLREITDRCLGAVPDDPAEGIESEGGHLGHLDTSIASLASPLGDLRTLVERLSDL